MKKNDTLTLVKRFSIAAGSSLVFGCAAGYVKEVTMSATAPTERENGKTLLSEEISSIVYTTSFTAELLAKHSVTKSNYGDLVVDLDASSIDNVPNILNMANLGMNGYNFETLDSGCKLTKYNNVDMLDLSYECSYSTPDPLALLSPTASRTIYFTGVVTSVNNEVNDISNIKSGTTVSIASSYDAVTRVSETLVIQEKPKSNFYSVQNQGKRYVDNAVWYNPLEDNTPDFIRLVDVDAPEHLIVRRGLDDSTLIVGGSMTLDGYDVNVALKSLEIYNAAHTDYRLVRTAAANAFNSVSMNPRFMLLGTLQSDYQLADFYSVADLTFPSISEDSKNTHAINWDQGRTNFIDYYTNSAPFLTTVSHFLEDKCSSGPLCAVVNSVIDTNFYVIAIDQDGLESNESDPLFVKEKGEQFKLHDPAGNVLFNDNNKLTWSGPLGEVAPYGYQGSVSHMPIVDNSLKQSSLTFNRQEFFAVSGVPGLTLHKLKKGFCAEAVFKMADHQGSDNTHNSIFRGNGIGGGGAVIDIGQDRNDPYKLRITGSNQNITFDVGGSVNVVTACQDPWTAGETGRLNVWINGEHVGSRSEKTYTSYHQESSTICDEDLSAIPDDAINSHVVRWSIGGAYHPSDKPRTSTGACKEGSSTDDKYNSSTGFVGNIFHNAVFAIEGETVERFKERALKRNQNLTLIYAQD